MRSVEREGGGRGRLGLEKRRRGEARQSRLEAVNDVEGADRERGREVGPHAHGQGDPLGQRRRDCGTDRDDITDDTALQRPSALEQVGCTRGGRNHRHRVPTPAQLLREAADVLVDVVRL